LHVGSFASGRPAALRRVEVRPSPEVPDDAFPLVLITGRKLHQFNAGTMTTRTPNALLRPSDLLDIHPEDARRHSLSQGQRIRLRSRYGQIEIRVNIDPGVSRGELFATFQSPAIAVNRVTSPHRDGVTHTPEYKVTAVQLEKIQPADA